MDTHNFDTLAEASNALTKDGFTDNFKTKDNSIVALYAKRTYQPEDLKIVHSFRFEGMTNPSDQTDLFGIIAHDGIKGTLSMSYGANSDENPEMIKQIPMDVKQERFQ
ncbi:hypothetical protein N6H18_12795 [Reichenbachiella agarivorans]|uniref:Phosphoribosylpyrophosphate synthetase n=1 Tax=Reichenbachiella agarivorans TaxID=2979464 RepID=A0ABY6CL33_9BACT|nr:hypothetical protein [Reichenbachiella agarivorans]UXP31226.1 hypothetical protein N6H18_12795 [Reichenbachiella agarivorans]